MSYFNMRDPQNNKFMLIITVIIFYLLLTVIVNLTPNKKDDNLPQNAIDTLSKLVVFNENSQ